MRFLGARQDPHNFLSLGLRKAPWGSLTAQNVLGQGFVRAKPRQQQVALS